MVIPLYHSRVLLIIGLPALTGPSSLTMRFIFAKSMIRMRPDLAQFGEGPRHEQKHADGGAQHQPGEHRHLGVARQADDERARINFGSYYRRDVSHVDFVQEKRSAFVTLRAAFRARFIPRLSTSMIYNDRYFLALILHTHS